MCLKFRSIPFFSLQENVNFHLAENRKLSRGIDTIAFQFDTFFVPCYS
jgi:hypothetical protein